MGNCGAKKKTRKEEKDVVGDVVAEDARDQSPATDPQNGETVEQGRRRLSLSQAAPVKPGSPPLERKGTIVRKHTTDWKTFLPKSRRRLSVFGAPSNAQQTGFENKMTTEEGGEEGHSAQPAVNALGVGYACKKGLKPESPNQDDFFIFQVDDWGCYGVFDGHGPAGHDISHFVHKNLPQKLFSHPSFEADPKKALKESFTEVHEALQKASNDGASFDCALSGTTGTVVLQRDRTLYVAHVGDSRAVLGRVTDASATSMIHKDLTLDHKPTDKKEKERIQAAGGEVRRLEGDIPHRVFVRGKLYPGLAMSRAIGDVVGSFVGVSCVPDVSEYTLDKSAKFFVICSDGVWEFMTSQEAVDLIAKEGPHKCHAAAEKLAQEAWRRWVAEEDNIVDDITVVLRWLIPDP